MNDTLSVSRIALLLKKYYAEDRVRVFSLLAVTFLVLAGCFIFFRLVMGFNVTAFASMVYVVVSCLFPLTLGYVSAHFFCTGQIRSRRIAMLTTPVSTAERFMAAIVVSLFGVTLMFGVAFVLADLVQTLVTGGASLFSDAELMTDIYNKMKMVFGNDFSPLRFGVESLTTGALLYNAYFLLCGLTFDRHPFLIGLLIFVAADAVLGRVAMQIVNPDIDLATLATTQPDRLPELLPQYLGRLMNVTRIMHIVATVTLYVLVFFRIRRSQLR